MIFQDDFRHFFERIAIRRIALWRPQVAYRDQDIAMSTSVDNITTNSIVMFNESFAATNEREGSEIARQIICALLEKRIKVFFVTHLYEFAHGFIL